ncbi:PREDICTED: uncharacterized protein C19orf52 homolog, partial [Lepidothrix coronata]|uniref:Uncharacterized protein C19orf52 homolog n=1 Tax=Lepidothrix coronata TaxID=321398 RepID=A0A6J0G716_9PASS
RWLRALCHDYSTSAREAWAGARRRPGTTLGVLGALGALGVCAGSVPDLQSLEGAAVAAGGALGRLPPGCRSPRAERRVLRLLRLRERGRLRVLSLGVLALAHEDPHGPDPALYAATCPHLRPGGAWWGWPGGGTPLDVGFLGRWWGLEAALRDWDVNDDEFGGLPEPLRRLDPRALRSEGNERLFLERLRPVVLRDEDIEGEGGP